MRSTARSYSPQFAADGGSILFAVEDDGYQYPAAVNVANGAITHLADTLVVHELAAAAGHTAVLVSSDQAAPRGLRARAGQAAAPEPSQRRPVRAAHARLGRGHRLQKPRRHRGSRADRKAPGLHARPPLSDHPVDPWRARTARTIIRSSCGATVPRSSGSFLPPTATWCCHQLSRRHRPRRAVCARHPRRLGPQGGRGSAGRGRLRHRPRHRRSAAARGSAAGATAGFSPTTRSRAIRASRRPSAAPAAATRPPCTARTSTSCSTTRSSVRRGAIRRCG